MSSRSLNKVQLIGNLTRDPELRYTPQGTPVCTIGLATNRSWADQSGQKQEETEFHRLVAWSKLAELCGQLLFKGRKIYVEGRLQTRKWQSQDGQERYTTEVIISDMIILDSRRREGEVNMDMGGEMATTEVTEEVVEDMTDVADMTATASDKKVEPVAEVKDEGKEVSADDIPF